LTELLTDYTEDVRLLFDAPTLLQVRLETVLVEGKHGAVTSSLEVKVERVPVALARNYFLRLDWCLLS
jgi:hypothetical protein